MAKINYMRVTIEPKVMSNFSGGIRLEVVANGRKFQQEERIPDDDLAERWEHYLMCLAAGIRMAIKEYESDSSEKKDD